MFYWDFLARPQQRNAGRIWGDRAGADLAGRFAERHSLCGGQQRLPHRAGAHRRGRHGKHRGGKRRIGRASVKGSLQPGKVCGKVGGCDDEHEVETVGHFAGHAVGLIQRIRKRSPIRAGNRQAQRVERRVGACERSQAVFAVVFAAQPRGLPHRCGVFGRMGLEKFARQVK